MVCVCVSACFCARTYLMLQLQHLGPVKLLDSCLRSTLHCETSTVGSCRRGPTTALEFSCKSAGKIKKYLCKMGCSGGAPSASR